MKGKEEVPLIEKLPLKPSFLKRKDSEGVPMTYSEHVSHLLETYATNNVAAGAEKEILSFSNPQFEAITICKNVLDE